MSINRWMNKLIVVYPYDEVLFGDKKEWSTDIFCGAGEPWKHAKCAATKVSTTPKADCLIWWPYPWIVWSVTTFGLWVLCLVWQREGEVMGRITSWEHGTSPRVTNWPGFPGMEWFPGMQDSRYQHLGTHKQTVKLVTRWPHQIQYWSASKELLNLGIHGY